ncbi:MAG: nuclear transport factor 2 family protein [Bacteroidota bacterium]|nr:nuclear transport factor 2 family protein [Bacteroidota bacterium]MDP4215814.1 nuclear transport factor 2 family protein [Bacteroidota bacterium]MDP4247404.1 nuclear transport factor 2 family protein [Bacteroidota bacterium]MDP4260322.1 nuclear transport factor 2 family protein [Bacteroidota bacterium]
MAQPLAGDTVLSFIKALNAEDFKMARSFVHPDLTFIGVLGTRHGADAYFADMEKMKLKYEIEKTVADETDACLWYAIQMGGKKITACGWYHLENGKIAEFKVLFDPRPLL